MNRKGSRAAASHDGALSWRSKRAVPPPAHNRACRPRLQAEPLNRWAFALHTTAAGAACAVPQQRRLPSTAPSVCHPWPPARPVPVPAPPSSREAHLVGVQLLPLGAHGVVCHQLHHPLHQLGGQAVLPQRGLQRVGQRRAVQRQGPGLQAAQAGGWSHG